MNRITTAVCEITVRFDEDSAIVEVSHYGVTDVEFTLDPQQREELALMLAPHYSKLQSRIDELEAALKPLVETVIWAGEDAEECYYCGSHVQMAKHQPDCEWAIARAALDEVSK